MARRLIIEILTVLALFTLTVDVASRITPYEQEHDLSNGNVWVGVEYGDLRTERIRPANPNESLRIRSWALLGCAFADAVVDGMIQDRRGGYYRTLARGGRHQLTVLRLPLWMIFVLFAAYPCVAFIRGPMRRYRRKRCGRCPQCGYNLTGNVSGRCPECSRTV